MIMLLLSSMMTPVISEETLTPKNLKTNSVTTKLESAKTGDSKIDKEIDKIISHIERSLADELWIDETHLDSDEGIKVFHSWYTAIQIAMIPMEMDFWMEKK
ncbi:MAG: hypothetical protein SVM80_10730 [Halobacteriota archaeon]|nr:hypothetical protein [Halobacteriota archaeon]